MAKWGKVLKITEIMKLGPTGEPEKYYRYQVETAKGTTFSHEIPEAETTQERVEEILKARAEQLDRTMIQ